MDSNVLIYGNKSNLIPMIEKTVKKKNNKEIQFIELKTKILKIEGHINEKKLLIYTKEIKNNYLWFVCDTISDINALVEDFKDIINHDETIILYYNPITFEISNELRTYYHLKTTCCF